MAEQKAKTPSENGEFKTAPLGFDKNEVMSYILNLNKERKSLQSENEELKFSLERLKKEAEATSSDASAELAEKKAALDAQIIESRKQVLDERRRTAQTEKELHVLQDQFKALAEEYDDYKKRTAKKLQNAKKPAGAASIDKEKLAELSAKASDDANAVIADAQKKAEEIIAAAKAYAAETVKKADEYKTSVSAQVESAAEQARAESVAITASVDVFEVLAGVAQEINNAVNKAFDTASEKAKETINTPVETAPTESVADSEGFANAKAALGAIAAFDEASIASYAPMQVEPYKFELEVVLPEPAPAEEEDDEIDDLLADSSVLSSLVTSAGTAAAKEPEPVKEEPVKEEPSAVFEEIDEVITSDDMSGDISDLLADVPAAVTTPAPAETKKAAPKIDDISDLLADAPAAPTAKAPVKDIFIEEEPVQSAPAADDFSDLLADAAPAKPAAPAKNEAPKAAPAADDFSDLLADVAPAKPAAPAKKEAPKAAPAADDFSDLLADAPSDSRSVERATAPVKERLNESRAMGVAGKEEKPDDPWKALEAEMNGLTFDEPPKKTSNDAASNIDTIDDDSDEKIDMSAYSSMLDETKELINQNAGGGAQYDPAWDLALMEGTGDDDDEMSSDSAGFFDL